MILDTNALSAFIDGEPAVGVRLSAESQVAIPVIVLGGFCTASQAPVPVRNTSGGWRIICPTSRSSA